MLAPLLAVLFKPSVGLPALLVGAVLIAVVLIYKYRSQMNPELAKVRALEKVIKRSMPWWRRREDAIADECVKSAINALSTSTSEPVNEDPAAAQDEAPADEHKDDTTPEGRGSP
ncbi:hypothetical protein FXN61_08335 [Lentzea sp. PSKA42]|uniref:Uncharacterized protein n=1 Tax=Lentzea indica TaxID=2604800 RepID=A0ABX1FD51_9PSEU|nr:hypothetical protein [Lentzea indica]NKE56844.1 hypothetical protein [Lentzea indica]